MNALYSLYDALVSIDVPADKARAVVDAMERDMAAILATKSDIELLRASMTIRLGSMLVVANGILLGALTLILRWVIR